MLLRNGSPASDPFVAFYQRYYRTILTVAQQRLGGLADAEDATSEVFRITWVHYRQCGTLDLAWVYQTLRNVIGTQYRRQSMSTRLISNLGRSTEAVTEPKFINGFEQVHAAVRRLDERDREVLFMAYWEDLTRSEIAHILGCTAPAVRMRLHRAKCRLAALLKPAEPGHVTAIRSTTSSELRGGA